MSSSTCLLDNSDTAGHLKLSSQTFILGTPNSCSIQLNHIDLGGETGGCRAHILSPNLTPLTRIYANLGLASIVEMSVNSVACALLPDPDGDHMCGAGRIAVCPSAPCLSLVGLNSPTNKSKLSMAYSSTTTASTTTTCTNPSTATSGYSGHTLDHWSATMLAAQALARTKKVFIGGVATATTAEELEAYFADFGRVSLLFYTR
ncbi:unnamed protein product [Protopolystoma xenopodis]|uniref:RRM domain-containing protein n=1 Tax=Protopolystoma xenopodis TaxID=117903 RepID=A0A448WL98_9PLAT|nr:unnamed protein product [Protopolystoma xenopodis]